MRSRAVNTYDGPVSDFGADGRLLRIADANGNTRAPIYDASGPIGGWQDLTGAMIHYMYDAAGNLTSGTDSGTTTAAVANALNEITRAGTTTYGYDADGRVTSMTDATGTTTYTYNALGRPVTVVTPAGRTDYEYDGLGLLDAVIRNGQRTNLLVDTSGVGNVAGEFDASGNPVARYTQGIGLVSQVDASGNASYYNFDDLGRDQGDSQRGRLRRQ